MTAVKNQNSTIQFRNEGNKSLHEISNLFRDTLEQVNGYSEESIDELATAFAKRPTDNFTIYETGDIESAQGDIIIWGSESESYKANINRLEHIDDRETLVLQDGNAVTGDHEIIPATGSTYTIKQGEFTPKGLNLGIDFRLKGILFETDKPFLIFHREHGNIALREGKYLFSTMLDPSTLLKVQD